MTRSIPRRFALALTVAVGVGFAMAPAALASTAEGPYGPITAADGGTCGNIWANFNGVNSTYHVGAINNDGSYDVTLRDAGKFVTVAGSSPGACNPSNNGDTIVNNVHGHVKLTFYLVVTGGTFNPSATGCGTNCASDPYSGDSSGIDNFVATFFPGATWSFSTTKDAVEVAATANTAACLNKWTVTTQGISTITSSTGDIATTCN